MPTIARHKSVLVAWDKLCRSVRRLVMVRRRDPVCQ